MQSKNAQVHAKAPDRCLTVLQYTLTICVYILACKDHIKYVRTTQYTLAYGVHQMTLQSSTITPSMSVGSLYSTY